jgi:hypothetical protein
VAALVRLDGDPRYKLMIEKVSRGSHGELVYLVVDELPFWLHQVLRRFIVLPRFRRMLSRGADAFCLDSYDKCNCIFVQIPKAAGVSVSQSLFGRESTHFTAREYRRIFGSKKFEDYFRFTMVRNPWDRLHSAFVFVKRGGLNQMGRPLGQEALVSIPRFKCIRRRVGQREERA